MQYIHKFNQIDCNVQMKSCTYTFIDPRDFIEEKVVDQHVVVFYNSLKFCSWIQLLSMYDTDTLLFAI